MANRLVIRYYPVDGEFSPAEAHAGSFGVSLWLQPGPDAYDFGTPTMGALVPVSGDLVSGAGWWGNPGKYASVVYFETNGLVPGQFVEREVFLLETDSATVRTISKSDLPLDVFLAGPGAEAIFDEASQAWRTSAFSAAGYAGGALEIGLYEDEEYTALGSLWLDGYYSFTPKFDGTSWLVPGLPAGQGSAFWDPTVHTGALKITLRGGPPSGFWTQFARTREVI